MWPKPFLWSVRCTAVIDGCSYGSVLGMLTSLDRDESRNFLSRSRIKFLGSRVSRMSPKLGLQYASCCEWRKAHDWPTLEAGWRARRRKSAVTAFEVSSRGWPVAGAVAVTGVCLRRRSSQLLDSSTVESFTCPLSHCCRADPVSLYCIWQWLHLFILVRLNQASMAGDGTDFQTQDLPSAAAGPSCLLSANSLSHKQPWNLKPVYCRRRGHFREAQSADCLI